MRKINHQKIEIVDDNNNLDYKNTQWHIALPSAIKLELIEYRQILKYQPEYWLNTKALQIDLLIIKKENNTIIKNVSGKALKMKSMKRRVYLIICQSFTQIS